MERLRFAMPASFVLAHVHLSWTDVLFGLDQQLLAPGAPAELAAARLDARSPAPLIELAAADRDAPVRDLVIALSTAERPANADAMRDRWLYLILAWTYEHRATLADPLGLVETVYADLGYPEVIRHLVRRLPATAADAAAGDVERRLLAQWKLYLERTAPTMRPLPVPMDALLAAAERILGFVPESAVPDALTADRSDLPWLAVPAWDTLSDLELARFSGLMDVPFVGEVVIATEVSFDTGRGAFTVPARALLAFVEYHRLWFGEPFFNGDVVLACPDAGLLWIFHHEGMCTVVTGTATRATGTSVP